MSRIHVLFRGRLTPTVGYHPYTLFTVPSGQVYVMQYAVFFAYSTAGNTWYANIVNGVGGQLETVAAGFDSPVGATVTLADKAAMSVGDSLQVNYQGGGGGLIGVTVSGLIRNPG